MHACGPLSSSQHVHTFLDNSENINTQSQHIKFLTLAGKKDTFQGLRKTKCALNHCTGQFICRTINLPTGKRISPLTCYHIPVHFLMTCEVRRVRNEYHNLKIQSMKCALQSRSLLMLM